MYEYCDNKIIILSSTLNHLPYVTFILASTPSARFLIYSLQVMATDTGLAKVGTRFFESLFENLPNMDNPSTQRLLVMAFSNLIAMPLAALPPACQANIQNIFMQSIREVTLLQEAKEDVCLKTEEDGNNENDYDEIGDDWDDADNFGEEDEGSDEDEEAARGVHSRVGAAVAGGIPEGGYDEDEDVENAEDAKYVF